VVVVRGWRIKVAPLAAAVVLDGKIIYLLHQALAMKLLLVLAELVVVTTKEIQLVVEVVILHRITLWAVVVVFGGECVLLVTAKAVVLLVTVAVLVAVALEDSLEQEVPGDTWVQAVWVIIARVGKQHILLLR
jgi:hypothetical protein